MKGNCSNNSDCNHFETLINKRLDGDITTEENDELDCHLADCDDCRDELVSFQMIRSLLEESSGEQIDVPDGLFESLAEKLEDKKPATSIIDNLVFAFMQIRRGPALAMASVLLLAVLVLGVGYGIADAAGRADSNGLIQGDSLALIRTNNGETIVVVDDQQDAQVYREALDDLERAYVDAAGTQNSNDTSGYIHTSWDGGDQASPIH